jgi:hypothetical protein
MGVFMALSQEKIIEIRQKSDIVEVIDMNTTIYNKIFKEIYYINMPSLEPEWIVIMDSYKGLVNKTKPLIEMIRNVCGEIDKNNNNFSCVMAYVYCENIINNFIDDVKLYNERIEDYNKWADGL